jgi:aminopeptidase N
MECFDHAYQQEETEGEKINLVQWMDSWLKTAGVNTLKANLNDKTYEVEQHPAIYGDKLLRE